jgi:hypothetical protein
MEQSRNPLLQATTARSTPQFIKKKKTNVNKKLISSLVEKINNQNNLFSPIVLLALAPETILP